jgi:heme-degrading monooxygenase HmoA
MPFVSVNVFTLHSGEMRNFVQLQREAFLPLLAQQPGFVAFEVVQTGPDTGVATLWWESEDARRSATPALSAWVEEHLDPLLAKLENPAGPVVLSSRDIAKQR